MLSSIYIVVEHSNKKVNYSYSSLNKYLQVLLVVGEQSVHCIL